MQRSLRPSASGRSFTYGIGTKDKETVEELEALDVKALEVSLVLISFNSVESFGFSSPISSILL